MCRRTNAAAAAGTASPPASRDGDGRFALALLGVALVVYLATRVVGLSGFPINLFCDEAMRPPALYRQGERRRGRKPDRAYELRVRSTHDGRRRATPSALAADEVGVIDRHAASDSPKAA
jgi:hypothetical protein